MTTLGQINSAVRYQLQDFAALVWSHEAIVLMIREGYSALADLLLFWDWVYLEDLPPSFSYTAPWERAFVVEMGGFDAGCANFTCEDERRMLDDERLRIGPGTHTSPFEATDGWLASVEAAPYISATAEVPKTLLAIDRVTWDNRGIEGLHIRDLAGYDTRYEVTRGEVHGFLWRKDGVRTLRKVRVPAAMATCVYALGDFGILRQPADLSADVVTGTWGIPRRIPGMHPIGTESFGLPRRPYLEGKNVRVEHFRQGRPMDQDPDVCELPDRYTRYLRDYALARLHENAGPGQDLVLAAHYQSRWERGVARIVARLDHVDHERVGVLGGAGQSLTRRPPRPSRPWQYGSGVR